MTIEILLKVDIIENYNIDLLIFKRIITLDNNEISMIFKKIENIMINHAVINQIVSINSFNLLKIESFKSTSFANCFNSTSRIHFSVNNKSKKSQIDKKIDSIQVQKEHKCQRCFRIFCSNNELHRHIVNIHIIFRRHQFFECNHRFKDFVDF